MTWATRLVFSPVVWAGIVLAGVSVVLFGVSAAMRARGPRRAAEGRVPAKRSLDHRRRPGAPGERSSRRPSRPCSDDDMDDIEAILRKHGIQ